MLKIKEAIIVEGTYDKIKLGGIVDATIVTTDGFDIFKNRKKAELIKMLSEKNGIVILTDSDRAGFQIRNYVKNIAGNGSVKHAYIPDIKGKEKRKDKPSKEGFLGVEGVSDDSIIDALIKCGCTETEDKKDESKTFITKKDLFSDGLSGGADSADKRRKLTRKLKLPDRISANMLLDVLNQLYTYDEYKDLIGKL